MLVDRKRPKSVPVKIFADPVPLEAGETASEKISGVSNPELAAVQLAPLSVERKTPALAVPANKFGPETTSAATEVFGKQLLAADQLVPLLVERKMPPVVPASKFAPEVARAPIGGFGRPLLTGVQLEPLSVERNTPPDPY